MSPSQLLVVRPIGFSQTTCFLASRAKSACSACKPFGVQILTTSKASSLFNNACISVKKGTPKSWASQASMPRGSTSATSSPSASRRIISAWRLPICPAPTTANLILLIYSAYGCVVQLVLLATFWANGAPFGIKIESLPKF